LLFENYGQEVGGSIHVGLPNLKVGGPPVPTVVAPMMSTDALTYSAVCKFGLQQFTLATGGV